MNEGSGSLIKWGFTCCGKWVLCEGELHYVLQDESVENTLYAFATDTIIGYIGKAEKRLSARLYNGYSRKVNQNIRKCLNDNQSVLILCYKPTEKLIYREMQVDMLSGLEKSLQKKFRTKWTQRGNTPITEAIETIVQDIIDKLFSEKNDKR